MKEACWLLVCVQVGTIVKQVKTYLSKGLGKDRKEEWEFQTFIKFSLLFLLSLNSIVLDLISLKY